MKRLFTFAVTAIALVCAGDAYAAANCFHIYQGQNCGPDYVMNGGGCATQAQVDAWDAHCSAQTNTLQVNCLGTNATDAPNQPSSCTCSGGYAYTTATYSCSNCAGGFSRFQGQCLKEVAVLWDSLGEVFVGEEGADTEDWEVIPRRIKGNLKDPLTGTIDLAQGTSLLTGTGTAFNTELAVGDAVLITDGANTEVFTVTSITDAFNATVDSIALNNYANANGFRDEDLLKVEKGDGTDVLSIKRNGILELLTSSPTIEAIGGNFTFESGSPFIRLFTFQNSLSKGQEVRIRATNNDEALYVEAFDDADVADQDKDSPYFGAYAHRWTGVTSARRGFFFKTHIEDAAGDKFELRLYDDDGGKSHLLSFTDDAILSWGGNAMQAGIQHSPANFVVDGKKAGTRSWTFQNSEPGGEEYNVIVRSTALGLSINSHDIADAGTQEVDSPELRLMGSRWNTLGVVEEARGFSFFADVVSGLSDLWHVSINRRTQAGNIPIGRLQWNGTYEFLNANTGLKWIGADGLLELESASNRILTLRNPGTGGLTLDLDGALDIDSDVSTPLHVRRTGGLGDVVTVQDIGGTSLFRVLYEGGTVHRANDDTGNAIWAINQDSGNSDAVLHIDTNSSASSTPLAEFLTNQVNDVMIFNNGAISNDGVFPVTGQLRMIGGGVFGGTVQGSSLSANTTVSAFTHMRITDPGVTNETYYEIPIVNGDVSGRAVGDVMIIGTGSTRQAVSTTVLGANFPIVVTAGNGGGLSIGFAAPGSIVTVKVDTGAVSRGDRLVTSTTAQHATVDNAASFPKVLAVALQSKSAGSTGTVLAKILQ